MQAMLDPRRLLRWIYIGRLSIGVAIFLAAVFVWTRADADKLNLLIASLAFALTTAVTVASVAYSEIYKRPLRSNFLYLQCVFDLLLVTSVVHVTGSAASQFAALYILVIASSTLLLPLGGGFLIATLGNVLYVADVLWAIDTPLTIAVWLQVGVFVLVALGSGYLSVLLRREGEGKALVVAELLQLQLQADDILRNIRSGVLTVDSEGCLLYANLMAEQMLDLDLIGRRGQPIVDEIAQIARDEADEARDVTGDRLLGEPVPGVDRSEDRRVAFPPSAPILPPSPSCSRASCPCRSSPCCSACSPDMTIAFRFRWMQARRSSGRRWKQISRASESLG